MLYKYLFFAERKIVMGKFDGILICSDLDDTLISKKKVISNENISAINYFMSEGGAFAFATGRVPLGIKPVLEHIKPNVPVVCYNGGGIFDCEKNEIIWEEKLDCECVKAVDFAIENFPEIGVEVCGSRDVYFCRMNDILLRQKVYERFPDNYLGHYEIKEGWNKVLFTIEEDKIEDLRSLMVNSRFSDRFEFIRSSKRYFEMLPKNVNKGRAMLRLATLLNIDPMKTVGIGDNENDIGLVRCAGVGVAVANASNVVKESADIVTVDCDSHALKHLICDIESGIISF